MSTVKEELVSNLKDILSFGSVFPIDKYAFIKEDFSEDDVLTINEIWENIFKSVSFMADKVESFNFDVDSAGRKATSFNSSYKNFKNALLNAGSDSNEMLTLLIGALDSDARSLKELILWSKLFECKDIEDEEKRCAAKIALNEFCETGEIIRNTGYEGTMISVIEKLLCGNVNELNIQLNRKGKDEKALKAESLNGTIIALAAPSLEGKTQIAFVFRDIIPLYFALNATEKQENAQDIYLNYASLNATIEACARRDLNTFVGKESDLSDEDYKNISRYELLGWNSKKKSFVLGFICALLEDAKTNYLAKSSEERGSWMKYHAERNGKKLSFKAQSIADVMSKRDYFKGFCLFLDEFVPDAWAVLVRSIARSIGLRCIVANKNGNIAHLTDKKIVTFSGYSSTASRCIWSIVITSLGFNSWHVLKKKYPNLEAKLNEMIEAVGNEYSEDKKLLKAFFDREKLEYVRPGLANFIAHAIVNDFLKLNPNFTLAEFMAELTRIISEKMYDHTSIFDKSDEGHAASLGLLFSDAYTVKLNSGFECVSSSLFHDSSFIEKHFYYLANPIDPENRMFITFSSTCRDPNDKISLVLSENGAYKWISEASYFKNTEFMTMLSSFILLPTSDSFYNTLNTARIEANNGNNDNDFDYYPYTLRRKSDINRLETCFVTASIIDASHHRMGDNLNDFEGQNGISLLNNFVENLIFQKVDRCKCEFFFNGNEKNFNLKEYLENLKIPFLYPENCEIPEELKKISVQNENQVDKTRSVFIEKFERPADSEQVDGIFTCYQKISEETSNWSQVASIRKRSCVLDYKNWKASVLYGDLEEIIRKTLGEATKIPEITDTKRQKKNTDTNGLITNAALSFIICDKIGKPNSDTHKQFNKFCEENNVNVFKLERNNQNDSVIEIVEMLDKLSSEPRNICIIIELATLNQQQS